jgi:limonene 1,2-monooxygenase
MHLAETMDQAKRDVAYGLVQVQSYLKKVLPVPYDESAPLDQRIEEGNATGGFIVGTPDMAIRQIERLWEQSGGFGAYLFMGADWADREATFRSYELFAREVMPHFTGQAAGPLGSAQWVADSSDTWVGQTSAAIGKAAADYEASKATS